MTDASTSESLKRTVASSGPLSVSADEKHWDAALARLHMFKEKFGHCQVPARYKDDQQLGKWVSSIRRIRNAQISGSAADEDRQVLTPERIAKLDEIGFKWSSKNQRHVPWEQRYEELVEFVVRFGHSQVPIGWEENVQLSHWISAQRQEYKLFQNGKKSRLSDDRIDRLNKLDFIWEAQRGGPRRKRKAKACVPSKPTPARKTKLPRVVDSVACMAMDESRNQESVSESSVQHLTNDTSSAQEEAKAQLAGLSSLQAAALGHHHNGARDLQNFDLSLEHILRARAELAASLPAQLQPSLAGIDLASLLRTNPTGLQATRVLTNPLSSTVAQMELLNQARLVESAQHNNGGISSLACLLHHQQNQALLSQLLLGGALQSNPLTAPAPFAAFGSPLNAGNSILESLAYRNPASSSLGASSVMDGWPARATNEEIGKPQAGAGNKNKGDTAS